MLDERKFVEAETRQEKEISLFCQLEGIDKENLNSSLALYQKIKSLLEGNPQNEEVINTIIEDLNKFCQENKENQRIDILLPIKEDSENVPLLKLLRKTLIENFFQEEEENKRDDINLVLEESLANTLLHSLPESNFALLSLKKGENGKINEIVTINFSDKEMPNETLELLKNIKENKEEAVNSYLNSDLEKINEKCQQIEISDEEFEKLCHRRGLEIVASLGKEIDFQKIDTDDMGYCYRFSFKI